MTPSPPPYRDVTVGDLLTRLAAALPNREALVYADGPRWSFAALDAEARTIARGLMALGVAPGERVVLWATNVPEWVVLQFALAKIGAILVTANTVAARPRPRLPAAPERSGDAHHHPRLSRSRLRRASSPRPARRPARSRRCSASSSSASDAAGRLHALRRSARRARPGGRRGRSTRAPRGRRRRRDQHAVHVGHDRVSEGRDADQPQHREQRLRARPRCSATRRPTACACACRCSIASAASSACSARYTHGGCLCVVEAFDPKRVLETVHRERCTGTLRRADDVHRRTRAPAVHAVRPDLAANRHHGRRALPGTADAPGDVRDAPAGDDDRVRDDRVVAVHHDDAARRVDRAAHPDGRAGAAGTGSEDRRSGDGRRARAGRARRAVLPRLQRDDGLLQQP